MALSSPILLLNHFLPNMLFSIKGVVCILLSKMVSSNVSTNTCSNLLQPYCFSHNYHFFLDYASLMATHMVNRLPSSLLSSKTLMKFSMVILQTILIFVVLVACVSPLISNLTKISFPHVLQNVFFWVSNQA